MNDEQFERMLKALNITNKLLRGVKNNLETLVIIVCIVGTFIVVGTWGL